MPKDSASTESWGANMAIAYDSKRLSADFPASLGLLVPNAGTQLVRALKELAREDDELGHDEFGDRARVGEGGVKYGDTSLSSRSQIDLVSTDGRSIDDKKLKKKKESRLK